MRVAILRRTPKASVSMDIYADQLVNGLKIVRPSWDIVEHCPSLNSQEAQPSHWTNGIYKYYERFWRFPASLKALNADIFHIIDHSDGYLSTWLGRTKRPNVITCHDLINLIKPATFKGRARFPLISMAVWRWGVERMRQADHVIAVSSHTKRDTVEQLNIPAQDITVIPNAVHKCFRRLSSEEIQAVRHQHGLAADTLCLLNVGSNNARKNISTILATVAELKTQGLPIHFWKIGADFNVEQKRFIQSTGLNSYVAYLGQPDENTLIQIYNAADCLMAPSLYEGFGLTILEAMACGTPVITANVSAMPEVAGDAAILVDPLNIGEIVQAVRYLYTHPDDYQVLAHKGLDRARRFTWENTAEQVARVYEQVLAQTRSPNEPTPPLESARQFR